MNRSVRILSAEHMGKKAEIIYVNPTWTIKKKLS